MGLVLGWVLGLGCWFVVMDKSEKGMEKGGRRRLELNWIYSTVQYCIVDVDGEVDAEVAVELDVEVAETISHALSELVFCLWAEASLIWKR